VQESRSILGDCREVLPTLPAGSVDAVITDPPYPEIDRAYGRLTEAEWWALVRPVVGEVRRLLKPSGSAVFVLQPNSERLGRMRPWLWEFMAWVCRDWNMVQDVWWWNHVTAPTAHCQRDVGLLRPSVKALVWCGVSSCYRDQSAVLWSESASNRAMDRSDRALRYRPSGLNMRNGRCAAVADERGGVTPFNLIPLPSTSSTHSAAANGHGAGTPLTLCRWWVKYVCPPGGTVLDPFQGSGTVGMAALREGCSYIGIEKVPEYHAIAERRLSRVQQPLPFGEVSV
jgi:DNA modification methylase